MSMLSPMINCSGKPINGKFKFKVLFTKNNILNLNLYDNELSPRDNNEYSLIEWTYQLFTFGYPMELFRQLLIPVELSKELIEAVGDLYVENGELHFVNIRYQIAPEWLAKSYEIYLTYT